MAEFPTWNRNPHTGPVYPITRVLWEPRGSSRPVSSSGGISTREIRKSSGGWGGTTGRRPGDWMKSGRPQHGLVPADLVSGPTVESSLHGGWACQDRVQLRMGVLHRWLLSGWVESHYSWVHLILEIWRLWEGWSDKWYFSVRATEVVLTSLGKDPEAVT